VLYNNVARVDSTASSVVSPTYILCYEGENNNYHCDYDTVCIVSSEHYSSSTQLASIVFHHCRETIVSYQYCNTHKPERWSVFDSVMDREDIPVDDGGGRVRRNGR